MNPSNRARLAARIAEVAGHALSTRQVVTPIEVLAGIGWLPAAQVESWRRGRAVAAMTGYHTKWTVPDEHRESAEYVEAGARVALGQAVYDRRTALGISQAELAARAGTTQTVISRLEGGAVTPTLPLLHRLAGALEGELDLKITGTGTRAEFPLAS